MWPSSVFGTSTPSLNIPDPEPGPERQDEDDAALADARPEPHLGEARRIGVVQDVRPAALSAGRRWRPRS